MLWEVRNVENNLANDIVLYGLLSSGPLIGIQASELYDVWNEIKDCKNLLEKTEKDIKEIDRNMEKLGKYAAEIAEQVDIYKTCDNDDDKEKLLKNIVRGLEEWTEQYEEVSETICKY